MIMKRKIKKLITGILLATIFIGSGSVSTVYARDMETTESEKDDQIIQQDASQNEQDVSSSSISENTNHNEDSVTAIPKNEENEKSYSDERTAENTISVEDIEFVYIESPYLETPGTQRIVISFGQKLVEDEDITLTVSDSAGNRSDWELTKQESNLYLFEKEYTDESDTDSYEAVSVNIRTKDTEKILELNDMGIVAEFGVNKEYAGIDELQPIDEEKSDSDSEIEEAVVTIDENGIEEAQNDIKSALQVVGKQQNSVSTFSLDETNARSNTSNNIVVALDPGHDQNDAGAQGHGLKEEELTLKIANYCKEELEKYAGVSVYMTRTTYACPYNCSNSGECIQKRVNAAKAAGADIFVSFHLNSSVASSANGAEIIIPNKNYKPSLGTQGQELAENILDELVKLGLTKRSIYSKNSGSGNKYPDGSTSDYFAVPRMCKEAGFSGIIIEHAFISNSNDVNKYLKTESGLKKLGVADATGIAQYFGLSKGYWANENGNTYFYINGQKVKGEKYISGKWYLFSTDTGAMVTGWYDFPDKRVYYDSTGAMVKGEKYISGKWYLFSSNTGAMVTGWYDFPNKQVYYDSTGAMVKGEQYISGKWYLFSSNTGAMVTGWYDFPNKRVYYDSTGAMVKGEKYISGKWYLFLSNTGEMVTGWYDFPNKRVYYDNTGAMVKGKQYISGKWYLFSSNTGAMVRGEQYISGKWYLFSSNTGAMVTGWYDFPNKRVYYDSTGAMVKGEQYISGKWYLFSSNTGAMVTGWYDFPNKRVYYDSTGAMVKGEKVIDGKTYYFDNSTGALKKNSFVGNNYYGSNGVLIPVNEYDSIFYKIEGKSTVNVDQMVRFYYNNSPLSYPSDALEKGGADTLEKLAQIFYDEANAEGIKVEVAWAQAMYETGWLQFDGQVKISQFNFAGIGALDGDAAGASFVDVQTGVRAQIQHLKAYASINALVNPCVDPRFTYVKRGCSQYVEILGQQENPSNYGWATSVNYGVSIKKLIELLEES